MCKGFKVCISTMFQLVVDENNESEKRFSAMDKRIQELRKRHGLLPGKIFIKGYSS